jgi:CheY-like chemotaxis protein
MVLMVATAEIERAVAASSEFDIHSIVAKPLLPSRLWQVVAQTLLGGSDTHRRVAAPDPGVLAGLHLLVAEDNALNQEVIEQILLDAGAQVTLVGNGQMAIDALQAAGDRFDAVLMDVQMPVMDGYAATQVIRQSVGHADLPIIALTAYARHQDREQSRRAGMSGHLSKPLDAQELLEVLVDAVGLRGKVSPRVRASKPAPERGPPEQRLVQAREAFGGEPRAYYRLVSRFLAQQGSGLAQARRRYEAGDTEGARQLLHSLGGMAGLLQMGGLSLLAEAAESAMRAGRSDQLPDFFDQLQAALDALSASMQELDTTVV